jgi:probable phosphoglycerate mutase
VVGENIIMTRLYLIRHGQYIEKEGEWISDPGLSPEGETQATRLRDRLTASMEIPADVVITSTMKRAKETVAILAPAFKQPVLHNEALCEWNNEDTPETWEGFAEKLRRLPRDQTPFIRPSPVCESWAEFMLRACNAIMQITLEHAGKNIVIVCHGGIIQASFLLFFGLSTTQFASAGLDPAYTSITHWQRIPGLWGERWILERFNDTAHL